MKGDGVQIYEDKRIETKTQEELEKRLLKAI